MAPKTDVIEQLRERVRDLETQLTANNPLLDEAANRIDELEEENARLKRTNSSYANLTKAQESQLTNLRQRLYQLKGADSAIDSERQANCELTEQLAASQAYAEQLRDAARNVCAANNYTEASQAIRILNTILLASTHDTSALDAYVAEKVKEAMK